MAQAASDAGVVLAGGLPEFEHLLSQVRRGSSWFGLHPHSHTCARTWRYRQTGQGFSAHITARRPHARSCSLLSKP